MAPKYAGFWIRFLADILDNLVLMAVSWILDLMILGAVYWLRVLILGKAHVGDSGDLFSPLGRQVFDGALDIAVSLPYYIIGHYRYGTTLGKYPLGIYVVDAKTLEKITLRQSVIRCLAYAVSYLPFGAGFLMVMFNREKRGLHDLIAGTVSVRKPKEPAQEVT